jgi:hypothetical protein
MPKEIEEGFKCTICGDIFITENLAASCEDAHNFVLVKFSKFDLFNLVQYIYTGDDDLLTPSLMKTLLKYKSNFGSR